MISMKRLLAAVMVLCVALSLCACGGNEEAAPTTTGNTVPAVTDPVVTEPVVTEPATQDGYIVKVVDEAGNPMANVLVQLCKDSCVPGKTDENGVAVFNLPEDAYKASIMSMPVGFDYAGAEQEFYFADGSFEVTITLKAVA